MARRTLRQLEPAEIDPVPVVAVGVALWAAAVVVALLSRDALRDAGRDWWISAAVAGFLLGLVGEWYCLRRRRRIRRGTAPRTD